MMTTHSTFAPISSDDADRLDGTLPGTLSERGNKLAKSGQIIAVILLITALLSTAFSLHLIGPLAFVALVVFAYASWVVSRDEKVREPGYRVRFSVQQCYATKTESYTDYRTQTNSQGDLETVPVSATRTVTDRTRTHVFIKAERKNGSSWRLEDKIFSTSDEASIVSARQHLDAKLEGYDVEERRRLASVYAKA